MADGAGGTDPAALPPVLRLLVRTYEVGHRERAHVLNVPVDEWRFDRVQVLRDLARALDEASDAAEAAYDAARRGGRG